MLCRAVNRACNTALARRLLSTPAIDHQADPGVDFSREAAGRDDLLGSFGGHGDARGQRVLDLGCGFGARSLAVARAGAEQVIGVDLDVDKVQVARQAAERSGTDRVSFAVQDGSKLAFDAGRFDVVLLLDVIEHVRDPPSLLAECARVLGRGGRTLVSFPPYRSPWGAHLFTHVPIPWVHLLFPDREILQLWRELHAVAVARGELGCSARRARAIIEADSTADLWDCNGMTIERFLDLVGEAPFGLREIRYKTLGRVGETVVAMLKLREILVTRVTAVLVV